MASSLGILVDRHENDRGAELSASSMSYPLYELSENNLDDRAGIEPPRAVFKLMKSSQHLDHFKWERRRGRSEKGNTPSHPPKPPNLPALLDAHQF